MVFTKIWSLDAGGLALRYVSLYSGTNKGHVGDNIKSAVVSFVERLSSSRRFKMY